MKIVVDIFGGDNAPSEIIKGCVEALKADTGINLVMTGNAAVIEQELVKYEVKADRIEIVDAPEVITNDDVPTVAFKTKKNSSLVVACERVKNDDECVGLVSAGSTGAVLTGATLKIGRIKGVSRPALAPLLPTVTGGNVLLIDCGANVDCKASMLEQFAVMGSAFMQTVCGVDKPKVALLSNGTEDKKGNALTHEAFALLQENKTINFCGNMEARDILSGDYDVAVADGFYGNIALKSAEGTALMMMTLLKQNLTDTLAHKIAASMLKKPLKKLKDTMDYNKKGGAVFVGVEKLVVKAHGSSKASSICGAILQVAQMHTSKLIPKIKAALVNEE